MRTVAKWMLAAITCAAMLAQADVAVGKKVIGVGWCHNPATPDDFIAHADLYDKTGIDGVLVWLRGRNSEGKPVGMRNILYENWSCEMFASMVPKLKAMTAHRAFRENFLITMRSPRTHLDWRDDAVWARLAENMRVAACIARDGGCRGLHMDLEDYGKARQFFRQPGEMPYEDLCRLVRRRGAETFRGVFREYPEARILSFWFLSWLSTWYYGQDLRCLAHDRGDLWPSFVNGILDVLPPTARLIDGNEHAYRYSSDHNDFAASAFRTRSQLAALVEPENRERYERQMQIGFGLYLDMYVNPTNSSWYFPPTEGSRLETFRRNLVQALEVADEYVWLWSAKHQYAKWRDGFRVASGTKPETWDDVLPGFNDVIASEKDRDGFGRRRMSELLASGSLVNLVENGKCAAADGALPKPYGCWQPGKPENHRGRFGSDPAFGDGDSTSLCAEGVPEGCFTLKVKDIRPGALYLVKCSACGERTSVKVFWRDAKHKDTGRSEYLPFREKAGVWRRGVAVVRAPMTAKDMHLGLGVALAQGEKAWFDSIAVVPLAKTAERAGR